MIRKLMVSFYIAYPNNNFHYTDQKKKPTTTTTLFNAAWASDAWGSESDDAELSNCTLMVLDYLEQADQHKIGKKS